jgi:predicted lipoprotein with Yx(FWY)xxD motif
MRRLVIGLLALGALAACGGGAYGMATPSSSSATTVKVASSSLGSILTDARGATLYYHTADTESHSTCTGECALNWLPLLQPNYGLLQAPSGNPTGSGFSGKLASTGRSDGGRQVTYNDRPLYTFSGDSKPGDLRGQGIGGVWFVATPSLSDPDAAAEQPLPSAPAPATPTSAPAPAPAEAPATPLPPAPRAIPPPPAPAPGFNDHDADNAGGRSDGDGNG